MPADLGTAYVQIVPSAEGIDSNLKKVLDPPLDDAGTSGGETLGRKLFSKFKKVMMAAGIGKVVKESLVAGGALEQSLGGVETLFKENADIVKEYARDAFESCGLSANQYMEQATSFSASLLQSLDGDTEKAAKYAQKAMVDMSDNANKFGTDMGLIQNAYQGFAKGNYTMLDNLKLGYGGTKEEMERLIQNANRVKEANGEMADLSIESFADIVEAVHTIQTEMGVTGTTAKEASTTLIGSFNAMKAAAQNVLGNLALGESIIPSLNALVETVSTFVFGNLLPMIGNIFGQVFTLITEQGPQMALNGMKLLAEFSKGFVQGIPDLLNKALDMLQKLSKNILDNLPLIIKAGFETLSNFVKGVTDAIPKLIEKAPEIVSNFANAISLNFPTILINGAKLLLQFIKGILSAIPTLIENIPQIIKAIVDVIVAYNWVNLGSNIVNGMINGIKSMIGGIGSSAQGIVSKVTSVMSELPGKIWSAIKSIPSKLTQAFKFTIPHIALPHISISGKLSLKPPSVPKIGIKWYAQGGLFNGAQIAGIGEAGPEYALPLNKRSLTPLALQLDELSNEDQGRLIDKLDVVIQTLQMLLNAGVYIDGDKLVGAILPEIDRGLGGAY